jgi:hypothetical protein
VAIASGDSRAQISRSLFRVAKCCCSLLRALLESVNAQLSRYRQVVATTAAVISHYSVSSSQVLRGAGVLEHDITLLAIVSASDAIAAICSYHSSRNVE